MVSPGVEKRQQKINLHIVTQCVDKGVKKALTRAPQAVVLTLHPKFKQMERKTVVQNFTASPSDKTS
jgi:hypothetical protein